MTDLPNIQAMLSSSSSNISSIPSADSKVLNAIQSPVLFFNIQGELVYANAKAVKRFRLEEYYLKTFEDVAPFWDEPKVRHQQVLAALLQGKAAKGSLERSLELGMEYWFEVDKIPVQNEAGQVEGLLMYINDVSEHIHREIALQESEARYKAFISNSSDAIWCYDVCPPIDTSLPVKEQAELLQTRAILAECNTRLARLFEAEKVEDVIGMPLHRNGSLTNKRDIIKFIKNGYRLENGEFTRVSLLGEKSYIQNSAMGIIENGYLTRTWGTSRDITIQKSYLDHVEFMATHDELTLLPNRTLLYRTIEETLTAAKYQKMALLLIDLDKFKEINDTLGHIAGDRVLKELGPRLEAEMDEVPGMIARLGGDEFAIFLPKLRNAQQAVVMGHRFLDAICEPFELDGVYSEISASIGITITPDQSQDVSTMMRYADVAMYHAKNRLKGVAVYDPEYDSYSPIKLELSSALRRGIREEQLCLHYQPKLSLETGRVYGFEALVRWEHPEYGLMPPSQFVDIAETSNMIYPMTNWVMRETVKQCAKWHKQGLDICVAMNLSARNLMDERIVDDLEALLAEYQVPGHLMEMEITESMIMFDPIRAKVVLDRISELGVYLSVDDFGTGYSSLAYLKKLPVQVIKIDKSFVKNLLSVDQDAIIVHSTIQLAHNLGLKVVAEGVENHEIMKKLEAMGCNAVQGYYVSRPMPIEQITHWWEYSEFSV